MTYSKLIEMQIDDVFLKGTATKILQHMDRIRNVSDLSQSRRWVMELIQNARDVAYPDRNVKIRIELRDNALKFMHSGKPFRIRDILSIVNQVSSKGDDDSSVGKFGTGFMTTYQLSEQVEIDSVLSDSYDGISLPPKKFHITIDRQGYEAKTILEGIEKSMTELRTADSFPETDLDPDSFNTVFTYHLDNAGSLDSARTGVEDLRHNILFIMLFSKRIGSIEISADNINAVYERIGEKTLSEGLKCAEILCERDGKKSVHRILFSEDGKLSAAALIDENNRFIPISKKTPRLFIDFPLIGAEDFPFPVVINDIEFKPNEPRSGITLVDNEKSVDTVINKQIMLRAAELFKTLINTANKLGFSGFENIIASPKLENNKEISERWFTENITEKLCEIISSVPFILTSNGTAALADESVRIISYKTEKQKEILGNLVSKLNGYSIPTDNTDWAAAFEGYSLAPEKIVDAEKLCKDASYYVEKLLDKEVCAVPKWCSMLYEAAFEDDTLGMKIRSGEYAIFPDQANKTQLHDIKNIYKDSGIPEIIKQISDCLDESFTPKYSLRSSLLSPDFCPQEDCGIAVYEASKIKSRISECTDSLFDGHKGLEQAVMLMISCGKKDDIYYLMSSISAEPMPEKTDIGVFYDENTWYNSYCRALSIICRAAEKYSSLDELAEAIGADCSDKAVGWLNTLLKYNVNSEYKIYPNIYGKLIAANRKKGQIFTSLPSFNTVSEPLIKILEKMHARNAGYIYDFDYIFDRRIKSNHLSLGTLTDEHFSVKINNAVKSVMNSVSLGESAENIQQACTMLLNYITKNPQSAKEYFPDFASEENRMKLLTPNEALKLSDKATVLDNLIKKYELGNDDDLERIVAEYKFTKNISKYPDNDYNEQWDCGFGREDVDGMSKKEFEEFCRNVGTSGENYIFEDICQKLEFSSWTLSGGSSNAAEFKNGSGETVEVFRPDSENYRQCGWDIRIKHITENSEKTYYVEVKTHTSKSICKNEINISREQLKMSMKAKENYIVALVEFDKKTDKCTNAKYYRDVFKYIGNGDLRLSSGIMLYAG